MALRSLVERNALISRGGAANGRHSGVNGGAGLPAIIYSAMITVDAPNYGKLLAT